MGRSDLTGTQTSIRQFIMALVGASVFGTLILGAYSGATRSMAGAEDAVAGLAAPGNQLWSQDAENVVGVAEANDGFGSALAAGDFNGDGNFDLAIGVPFEAVGAATAAGSVNVLYSSSAGPNAGVPGNALWNQDSPDVFGTAEIGDRFGAALAAGDFDGDGYDDLAIGVPGEEIEATARAGVVNVLYGSASGLTPTGSELWHQNVDGVQGTAEEDDEFGAVLTAGDFNADGRDDLAIGVPDEDVGDIEDAGAVNVLYGQVGGLTVAGNQLWHQDIADIQGDAGVNDAFGIALVAGDFNGDGYKDLAVGVSGDAVGAAEHAGAVNVLYGSGAVLTAANNTIWHQDSPGVPGGAETDDRFGQALAAGDFDHDGRDDLAIGVPFETVSGQHASGAVNVLKGSADGITGSEAVVWSQDSVNRPSDAPGVAEANDHFGMALAAGDFNNDGLDDLAIGVPGESDNRGAVNILHGIAMSKTTTPDSLTTTSSQVWHQDVASIEGTAEAGDNFGASLVAARFNSDTPVDLAIGVPGESIGDVEGAGAVNVLYGEASPLHTPTPTSTATDTPAPTATPTPSPLLAGDVNCDGLVNAIDATVILQFSAGLIGSVSCPQNADVNDDGEISSLDAALLLQYVAGLISSLPP